MGNAQENTTASDDAFGGKKYLKLLLPNSKDPKAEFEKALSDAIDDQIADIKAAMTAALQNSALTEEDKKIIRNDFTELQKFTKEKYDPIERAHQLSRRFKAYLPKRLEEEDRVALPITVVLEKMAKNFTQEGLQAVSADYSAYHKASWVDNKVEYKKGDVEILDPEKHLREVVTKALRKKGYTDEQIEEQIQTMREPQPVEAHPYEKIAPKPIDSGVDVFALHLIIDHLTREKNWQEKVATRKPVVKLVPDKPEIPLLEELFSEEGGDNSVKALWVRAEDFMQDLMRKSLKPEWSHDEKTKQVIRDTSIDINTRIVELDTHEDEKVLEGAKSPLSIEGISEAIKALAVERNPLNKSKNYDPVDLIAQIDAAAEYVASNYKPRTTSSIGHGGGGL